MVVIDGGGVALGIEQSKYNVTKLRHIEGKNSVSGS